MDGRHGEKRRDGDMSGVDIAVCEHDVAGSAVDGSFRLAAESGQGVAQALSSLFALKEHGQPNGCETLVADVTKHVKLTVVQDGVRKAHHLAVAFAGHEQLPVDTTYVFRQGHHQTFANGVDGRIGHLRELLTEVVEKEL